MDEHRQRVFIREVERQTQFGLVAAADLENALKLQDMERIWYSVQALLVAAGNVSKLLWPPKLEFRGRGEVLRKALDVPDGSPLSSRDFRNHFEHFDERLEALAESSTRGVFVDSNVGPPGMIAGLDQDDFLRNYDTSTDSVTFLGDSYPLKPVIEAIDVLHRRAKDLAR